MRRSLNPFQSPFGRKLYQTHILSCNAIRNHFHTHFNSHHSRWVGCGIWSSIWQCDSTVQAIRTSTCEYVFSPFSKQALKQAASTLAWSRWWYYVLPFAIENQQNTHRAEKSFDVVVGVVDVVNHIHMLHWSGQSKAFVVQRFFFLLSYCTLSFSFYSLYIGQASNYNIISMMLWKPMFFFLVKSVSIIKHPIIFHINIVLRC